MKKLKNKKRNIVATLTATLLFTLLSVLPASASTTTASYAYTGGMQTFIAPYTGTYTLEVWGDQGGYSGGEGGYTQGDITLNQNDNLNIYVGGQGNYYTVANNSYYSGGYNGGGNNFTGTCGYITAGGGGGTDIRLNSTTLTSRIIVAGGAGGGGTGPNGTINSGYGGGTSGSAGNYGGNYNSYNGQGGTQTSGGAGGINGGIAGAGTLGQGGYGTNYYYGSSGGGGGYYGGGGAGTGMGAGGGSGYTGGVTSGIMSNGIQTGNGSAAIVYTVPVTPSSPANLTCTNIAYASATLAWQTTSLATSYKIYKNGIEEGTTTAPTTTYKDNNLVQNTQYTYTVTALNGTIEGPSSLPLILTTQQYLSSIQASPNAPQKVRILLVSPDGLYYYDEKTKTSIGLNATPVTKQADVTSAGPSLITIKQP